ncbi:MAG: hypothetical protein GY797_12670, partial [Deltaproteobacteria bacterium]|nr:hypothetical protein [Deltaproteobacteria bacterium]
ASSIFAADSQLVINPHMFAQTSHSETVTPGEEKAFQQLYKLKISRLEREIAAAEVWRENILLSSFAASIGGTIFYFLGASHVRDAVKRIPGDDPEFLEEKEDALNALKTFDLSKTLSGIGAVSGVVLLLAHLKSTRNINRKQKRLDTLRSELDAYFEMRGLTPKYLQKSKSVAAVEEEIDALKKSARKARTIQRTLSSFGVAALLLGLFAVLESNVTHDVVETIDIDENDVTQVAAKHEALDKADKIQTLSFVFLGTYAVSAIAWYALGQRAKETDKKIDKLEDSLLGIVERVDLQPRHDGFMIMYTHRF